ncbi:MAG TPA: extracellular solute-binding protein [Mycobacteriales bacterium]|nr:extracellular solute-binding protein [Mycobacteriales bacterium]
MLDACSGVAGGSGGGGGGGGGGGKVSLQAAWWGGSDRAKRTQQVISLFEKKHKSWKISGQFSAWAGYWQKLDTQAAGGGLPDLLQMDMGYIGQYTHRDQILDMTKYGKGAIELSDFDKNQLAQGTVGGKLFGVSLGGNIAATLYNKTVLQKAGLQPPPEDVTWDQFASYCAKLAKKLPSGVYPSDDPSGSIPPFESWIRQQNRDLWTSDGKLAFTADDVSKWFQYWADLRAAKLIIPGSMAAAAAQDGTSQGTPIVRGQAAFTTTWSNFLGQYQILMKDSVGMMRNPIHGTVAGDYVKASQLWSLSGKTEHAEQTAAFIDFFLHDTDAVKILGVERGVPGSAATRAAIKPTLKPYDAAQIDFFDTYSAKTRAKTVLDPPGAGAVGEALTRAAQSIPLSKKSVADASSKFMQDAEKALSA